MLLLARPIQSEVKEVWRKTGKEIIDITGNLDPGWTHQSNINTAWKTFEDQLVCFHKLIQPRERLYNDIFQCSLYLPMTLTLARFIVVSRPKCGRNYFPRKYEKFCYKIRFPEDKQPAFEIVDGQLFVTCIDNMIVFQNGTEMKCPDQPMRVNELKTIDGLLIDQTRLPHANPQETQKPINWLEWSLWTLPSLLSCACICWFWYNARFRQRIPNFPL